LIPSAKLLAHTHLKSKTRNNTRWRSTFPMILHLKIREFIPLLEIKDVYELLLSAKLNGAIDTSLQEGKYLESVRKLLQKEDLSTSDL
jgi:hypothetical protein